MKIIDAHIHTNFHHPELATFAKEEKIPFSLNYLQRQLNQHDAAELVLKNENVYADLSAFCLSHPDKHDLQRITQDLNFALNYSGRPDKFLFGTDWPLVDIGSYIDTIKKAVPHKHHQKVAS